MKSRLRTLTEDNILSKTQETSWIDWFIPLYGSTLKFPKNGYYEYYWEAPTRTYVKITRRKESQALDLVSYKTWEERRNLYAK